MNRQSGSELDDRLAGADEADELLGLQGDDTLSGGAESDWLRGGVGVDTASYADLSQGVRVSLAAGGWQDTGGAGRDRLTRIENLVGTDAADRLVGDSGVNRLEGGGAADRLTGGGGADVFVFGDAADSPLGRRAADVVTDFASGVDKLDLSGIDANALREGDQSFRFIGDAAFSGRAGELRAVTRGDDVVVLGDTDGNGAADLRVVLSDAQVDRADLVGATATPAFDLSAFVVSRHVSGMQPSALALDWTALAESDFVL